MKKPLIISFLMMVIVKNTFGQITSDSQSTETLTWLIENPQIESDSLFNEKAANVFKWQALNYPNSQMRVKGISEFMDSSKNDRFFKEIVMIYTLSEFDNQINKNLKKDESAYFAIKNVLAYYNKLIQIDSEYDNPILDKYYGLSEKKLRKKLNVYKKIRHSKASYERP